MSNVGQRRRINDTFTLSEMDEEINALEHLHSKNYQINQGIILELLTRVAF